MQSEPFEEFKRQLEKISQTLSSETENQRSFRENCKGYNSEHFKESRNSGSEALITTKDKGNEVLNESRRVLGSAEEKKSIEELVQQNIRLHRKLVEETGKSEDFRRAIEEKNDEENLRYSDGVEKLRKEWEKKKEEEKKKVDEMLKAKTLNAYIDMAKFQQMEMNDRLEQHREVMDLNVENNKIKREKVEKDTALWKVCTNSFDKLNTGFLEYTREMLNCTKYMSLGLKVQDPQMYKLLALLSITIENFAQLKMLYVSGEVVERLDKSCQDIRDGLNRARELCDDITSSFEIYRIIFKPDSSVDVTVIREKTETNVVQLRIQMQVLHKLISEFKIPKPADLNDEAYENFVNMNNTALKRNFEAIRANEQNKQLAIGPIDDCNSSDDEPTDFGR